MRVLRKKNAYISEKRDTFVAGTFNAFDENEVTELPNVPDIWVMTLVFNDEPLNLTLGQVSAYKKRLNLKKGELTRDFIWEYDGLKLKFSFRSFVSRKRFHLLMSKVAIENLTSNPVTVALKSGINGQVSNEGSQHFTDGEKGLMAGKFIQMMPMTTGSKIQVVQTVKHRLSVENSQRLETGRRAFFMNYYFELAGNGKVEIEKRGNIYTSIDKDVDSHELKSYVR